MYLYTVILDTTYNDKSNDQLINDLVGKPFSFIEAFKMKGVGSKRMIIDDASPNFKPYLNTISDSNYAKELIGWEAQYNLEEMCCDSWNYLHKNKNNFN